jgi:hypothetical protein
MEIQIAGTSFALKSGVPLLLPPLPAGWITRPDPSLAPVCRRVDVEILETWPDLAHLPVVFECASWALMGEGSVRFLCQRLPSHAPVWVADLSGLPGAVRVFVGGESGVEGASGSARANPFRYPLDQLVMMFLLGMQGGLLVHAAGGAFGADAAGFVFCGRSGAGKSTLTRLLGRVPGMGTCFSDDRLIVRPAEQGTGYELWGTPWAGDAKVALNRCCGLRSIFFLVQSTRSEIVPLSPQDGVERLLKVVSIPWFDREQVSSCLGFVDPLAASVPMHEFRFRNDGSAVQAVQDFLGNGPAQVEAL